MRTGRGPGSGPTREIFDLDELQEVVSAGIEAILAGPAAALGKTFDFSRHRRLLDVGGGTGSWTIAVIERHPHLEATVLELPVVAQMARQRLAAAGLAERVTHYWSPETNLALLQRVRSATESGSHLLLADFWTDPTHTQPLHAALMAGEFAVHLRDGDVYSVEEVRAWLGRSGWRFVEHAPLAGPQSLIVAEAA